MGLSKLSTHIRAHVAQRLFYTEKVNTTEAASWIYQGIFMTSATMQLYAH